MNEITKMIYCNKHNKIKKTVIVILLFVCSLKRCYTIDI